MTPSQMQAGFNLSKVELTKRSSLRYIKGVGPERFKLLARLGLETLEDVFYFLPRRYEPRFPLKKIAELTLEDKQCVRGVVASRSLIRTRHGQSLFKLVLSDGQKSLFATWFNQPYLTRVFMPKMKVVLYGKPEKEGGHLVMRYPEYEIIPAGPEEALIHNGRLTPIYPLTEDLSQKSVRSIVYGITRNYASLIREYLPREFLSKVFLRDLSWAIRQIHFPESPEAYTTAYKRLVFDEFFLTQIVIQAKKARLQSERPTMAHESGEEKVRELLESAGFEPTPGQKKAIEDILADMRKGRPMNRLVQGDVGSGKTLVAAAALTFTVSNGFQGALMAPTEVLAQQHFMSLSQLLEPMGISCGLVTQALGENEKKIILQKVHSGELSIVIGTHALIQEGVRFKKLGLAVIDEQHKFGVFQRSVLREKAACLPAGRGSPAHFLLMTATPIPRTLAMTLYGDLDVSLMTELPKGRKAIQTMWVNGSKREEIYRLVDQQLAQGRQAYVICPLVEKDEKSEIKDVLSHKEELQKKFEGRRIGYLHGRMKSAEKKKVMAEFRTGHLQVLVSTVVIEVGVNVPNAAMMIIENAERFGLSQLHQLRGRVGRGESESWCVLFSDSTLPETAERLSAFEKTSSGFEIAEKDLELRGSGEVIGEKQHGLPELRIGDLVKDIRILEYARKEASRIIQEDPRLLLPKNQTLRRAVKERFKVLDENLVVTG